jgi:hypothetical protein
MISDNELQKVWKKTILALSDISAYAYRDVGKSMSRLRMKPVISKVQKNRDVKSTYTNIYIHSMYPTVGHNDHRMWNKS